MKKFLIVILFSLLFAASAWAAWTVEITDVKRYQWNNGQIAFEINLKCTSDASASGDITLSTRMIADAPNRDATMRDLAGGLLFAIEYVPDATATPTSAATITVDTASGTLIFSETVAVVGTGEMFDGSTDIGFNAPFTDLIFTSTTLANAKIAVFNIWIIK